ncbi:GNAT family N-acetyltransferase [Kitasatospora camelliae]|uniref:GNAT family N-acetyltransferase n=1 Tax=Kitasatospora camelliae TaxID=3156397 RepID=A0AAU8K3W8_9ACTN
MSDDLLALRAHGLWQELASASVAFPPAGGTSVVVSPNSGMCPPGWVGAVSIGGSAIVTAPGEPEAAAVRTALAGRSAREATDPGFLRSVLPVERVLGPAALAYLAPDALRPPPGAPVVERLPADHPGRRELEGEAGEEDAAESGIAAITSPAFVAREHGRVVAACGYRSWPARTAQFCVLTAPDRRGRGLAAATGAAAAAHALAAGLLPQWRARVPASRRVAQVLGFRELGVQLSVRLTEAGLSGARTGPGGEAAPSRTW